jgi:hypothetical protein
MVICCPIHLCVFSQLLVWLMFAGGAHSARTTPQMDLASLMYATSSTSGSHMSLTWGNKRFTTSEHIATSSPAIWLGLGVKKGGNDITKQGEWSANLVIRYQLGRNVQQGDIRYYCYVYFYLSPYTTVVGTYPHTRRKTCLNVPSSCICAMG